MNMIATVSLFLSMVVMQQSTHAFTPQQTQNILPPTAVVSTSKLSSSISNDDNNNKNNNNSSNIQSARQARIITPMSTLFTSLSLSTSTTSLLLPTQPASAAPVSYSQDFDTSIRTFFPGALPNSQIIQRVQKKLSTREYRPYNTILGASLCSDEIDSTTLSLQDGFKNAMAVKKDGGVFNLGGLGGVPFVGKSGFGAFLSHVPDSGKVLIIYGPHVGISNEGVVGKVERVGQSKPSGSCGAGVGAYKALLAGGRGANDKFDYQEEFIIDRLEPKIQDLLKTKTEGANAALSTVLKNSAIASVTVSMFDIINEVMEDQVFAAVSKPGFWDKVSEVTLLGGIVINRGHGGGLPGGEDFFQPIQLTALNANGEMDMFNSVFGDTRSD